MSEGIVIALIGAIGGLITAVVVEAIRRGRAQRRTDDTLADVLGQLRPNGGASVADTVTRIERRVGEVAELQREHGERLAAVEARVSDHIAAAGRV